MSREPAVIALVPHFRCEGWLDHCLASLVGQTRPLDGIVVVDDASPEPPVDIVRRFPGVTLLRSPRNVGPYRLVQQVIDDTAADWYMFQDADDWSAADRLERLLAGATASGAELIGSDYVMLTTDEGLTIPHVFPLDANAALAAAPTCHALQHPTSMVRRSLVERLGGYASGLRFSGDDEFLRRAAYATRVANVPRFLYFRRHRPDSLTTAEGTGHGSPARRQLLDVLGARAVANAAAVERGEAPALEPYAQAPPVALEHLCGPPPEGTTRRFVAPRAAAHRVRQRLRREDARPAAPTLIVGGPASGADTLLWSLGQHPSLFALLDVSWLASIAEAVDRAAEPTGTGHLSLSTDRRLGALDGLGATADDLSRALAASVTRVVADGSGDESAWVALAPPLPELVRAFLLLFPDARVIHVVRDVDQATATLARKSKAVPEPLPPGDAYQAWLDGVRAGLECERVAGGDRVLRVRFGDLVLRPVDVVARCLQFVGAGPHPRCARLVEGLDVAARPLAQWEAHPAAAEARDLSTALCGPLQQGSPSVAGRNLPVDPPVAPGARAGSSTPAPRAPSRTKPEPVAEATGPPSPHPLPEHMAGPAALLRSTLAPGAVVAVVTKGENRFLEMGELEVWHFPQTAEGQWAGYHPADTEEIVRHLEELWHRGARYFLIPPYASWWLDHYVGLRAHLLGTGSLAAEGRDAGSLFALGPGRPEAAPKAPASKPHARRRSVSVISWNTTHNPLGRAYVLADLLRGRYEVDLVGARFDHFGTATWPPLRDMEIPLRSFPGGPFPELFGQLEEFARTITSDVIVVSKPRLPSYLLGILAKAFDDRPLLLDVDDRELTFVGSNRPRPLEDLRSRRDDELANPYGRWWTELCESLVGAADHVTVSNETLRDLFGGTIIPHARDERLFDPGRVDREAARARFGFAPGERVVLFGGTPRRHKGVIELAEALEEVGDPRARLCLIDSPELEELGTELAPHSERLRVVPPQAFADLPELLAAADLVAVLQDPASEISRYQMPAKITDALAMQVPCLVRRVPPLEPLLAAGHLQEVGTDDLAATLAATLGDLEGARERARANREIFLSEYSFAAVRPRFEAVVESAVEGPRPLAPELGEVVAFARERFGRKPTLSTSGPPPERRPSAVRSPADGFDVVMFWKQHDSGLYGRRHDMLMQHLARSPRVGQVVQFDAPVDLAALRRPDTDVPTHNALLEQLAMARVDGIEAMPGLHQYSFVYGGDRRGDGELPAREEYAVHVKQALVRHGIGERPVVFWVYPKNFDFPDIARAFGPDLIVADVVDDHRTWLRPGGGGEERVLRNYEEIAGAADVVLVNCEPMRELMVGMGAPVHLVPNAAEYPDPLANAPLEVPEELQGLQGPIVGYVGNLSSRIDVELLERLVTQRPEWNLVLIGSAHAGRSVAPLAVHPNVFLLGPRPYDVAKRFIRAFDVALIPHLDDAMTRAMNPLKAFVYCALQVPVVSTDIANLGELRPLVSVASDHDDFIAKVDAAVRAGPAPIGLAADAVLRRNSWESRTQVITDLLDEALRQKVVDR